MVYFDLPNGEQSFARYLAVSNVAVLILHMTGLEASSYRSSCNNLCIFAF